MFLAISTHFWKSLHLNDVMNINVSGVFCITLKADKIASVTCLFIFFLSAHRACHAGIGRGDGWIIPLNIYIETMQFIPQQCTIFDNIGR